MTGGAITAKQLNRSFPHWQKLWDRNERSMGWVVHPWSQTLDKEEAWESGLLCESSGHENLYYCLVASNNFLYSTDTIFSTERTIFACGRLHDLRELLVYRVGLFETTILIIIRREGIWNQVATIIEALLRSKRRILVGIMKYSRWYALCASDQWPILDYVLKVSG